MQHYEWSIRVTTELLNRKGGVDGTHSQSLPVPEGEAAALARYEALTDHLANPTRRHPKGQRISAAKLMRRPVGDWEEVA